MFRRMFVMGALCLLVHQPVPAADLQVTFNYSNPVPGADESIEFRCIVAQSSGQSWDEDAENYIDGGSVTFYFDNIDLNDSFYVLGTSTSKVVTGSNGNQYRVRVRPRRYGPIFPPGTTSVTVSVEWIVTPL